MDADRLKKWADKNFMKLRRKFCTAKRKKKTKQVKQSGRPDWIEKTRAENLPDLAHPSPTSLVYTTLMQFYNTFKPRIQNT